MITLPRLTVDPGINVSFDLVFRDPVTLLNFPFELIALAGNLVQIVVCEVTPLLFDFTFGLLPVSFDSIPIHHKSPMSFDIRIAYVIGLLSLARSVGSAC